MNDEIRQQLRQTRRAQDITYRGLAKRLNVSAAHLCDIEKGRRHPSQELADKLKQAFPDVDVEKLVLSPCANRIAELEAENQQLKDAKLCLKTQHENTKRAIVEFMHHRIQDAFAFGLTNTSRQLEELQDWINELKLEDAK